MQKKQHKYMTKQHKNVDNSWPSKQQETVWTFSFQILSMALLDCFVKQCTVLGWDSC